MVIHKIYGQPLPSTYSNILTNLCKNAGDNFSEDPLKIIKQFLGLIVGVVLGSVVIGKGLVLAYSSGLDFPVSAGNQNTTSDASAAYAVGDELLAVEVDNKLFFANEDEASFTRMKEDQQRRMREEEELMQTVAQVEALYKKYNAPMANNAEHLVRTSKKYGVDYKLIVAISITESGGGVSCFRSYNPFGWGQRDFTSFNEAISVVTQGIANGYYAKGLNTVEEMAPVYNGANPEHWAGSINKVIAQL